jgi:hypothetical protein
MTANELANRHERLRETDTSGNINKKQRGAIPEVPADPQSFDKYISDANREFPQIQNRHFLLARDLPLDRAGTYYLNGIGTEQFVRRIRPPILI